MVILINILNSCHFLIRTVSRIWNSDSDSAVTGDHLIRIVTESVAVVEI